MESPAELARRRDKPFADAWIRSVIDADVDKGRSQSDFVGGDITQAVRKMVPFLNQRGFDVYQGGGNVFQVRHSPSGPVAVHVRPFAQRIVRLSFSQGGAA